MEDAVGAGYLVIYRTHYPLTVSVCSRLPKDNYAAKTVVDLTPYCKEPAIADVALPLSGNRLRDLAMLFATEAT